MSCLQDKFNTIAASTYIPADVLIIDKPYPIRFLSYETLDGGPRVILYISLFEQSTARIMLPYSLSPAFSIPDMYLINQNIMRCSLYVRRQPDPPYLAYYEMER
jgi:hypothetical protein